MRDLENLVEELVNKYIEESEAVCVWANDVGLDNRCGMIYVSVTNDFIAVSGSDAISYYGGFEYVPSDYITTAGHMTFYSGESSRVQECIEYYIENESSKKEKYFEKTIKCLSLEEESSPASGLKVEIKASSNSEVIIDISNSCTLRFPFEDAEKLALAVTEAVSVAEKIKT